MKSTHNKEIEQLVSGIIAGIRLREPILENPEGLTEDIMLAIRDNTNANPATITDKPGKSAVLTIMLRLTAAASVCLFLLFGYEEYILVDKITRLEKQNAAISQTNQYQAALNLKKAISIFMSDPEMKNRYKELKTRKINLHTAFKALMYVDLASLDPRALDLLVRTDYHSPDATFISLIKQFDSTDNNIQR